MDFKRLMHVLPAVLLLFAGLVPAAIAKTGDPCVDWGVSWDNIPLQQVLDNFYGPAAIDASNPLGSEFLYWEDSRIDALLVREVAGFANTNQFGWYQEGLGSPVMDPMHSGMIFDGPVQQGAERYVQFHSGVKKFGFWLNPNGCGGTTYAPEPEKFTTNAAFNDAGPTGAGALPGRCAQDVQCLIYDITTLRHGIPTWVLAWEDLDAGSPITPSYSSTGTDNDYQDLVVEIQAIGVVPADESSWGELKTLYR